MNWFETFARSKHPGAKARDEALERVEANAHEAWKAAANDALDATIAAGGQFTAEDVRAKIPDDVTTHELRAMGPIMRAAITQKRIKRVGYVMAESANQHRCPKALYQVI